MNHKTCDKCKISLKEDDRLSLSIYDFTKGKRLFDYPYQSLFDFCKKCSEELLGSVAYNKNENP